MKAEEKTPTAVFIHHSSFIIHHSSFRMRSEPMAEEIKVTPAGEAVTQATLLKWLKPDGALVKAGEAVCELETDKATKEEYAPVAGVLSVSAQPGTRLP